MDDLQTIHCPGCGKPLEVAPGSHLACPFCGQRLVIETSEPPRIAPSPAPRSPALREFPRSGSRSELSQTLRSIREVVMVTIALVIVGGGIWSLTSPNNPAADLAGFAAIIGLYIAPTLSALLSAHRHTAAIAIVNLLLGWTIVGWVAAAAWAAMRPTKASA